MPARCVALFLLGLPLIGGACSSGGDAAPARNTAAYLTIVKSPTDVALAHQSDQVLLGYGDQACAGFDKGERSDAVVDQLSGGALPGSAEYNSFAMVAAAAGKELCPQHAAEFMGDPNALVP